MDYDDEYHALCSAVGFVVVNWAITEQMLDGWVSIIFHDHGGKNIEPEIPRSLSKKVQFLKTCFKKLPTLAPLQDDALKILQNVKALSDRRHDLVHGAITSVTSQNGTFEFAKLDYEKQMHVVRAVHLNLNKFDDLAKEILDLGGEVGGLGIRLEELHSPLQK